MPKRRRIEPRLAKPFDAAMKELVGLDPATWLAHFGVRHSGPVRVLTTDLSGTVLADADQVLRIGGPEPWLVQLEFQSTRDSTLIPRLHLYTTLLHRRYGLPVQSIVVLLRPEADAGDLTGVLERQLPDGEVYLTFRYQVARVWEQSVSAVLAGPLATLPLAPLAAVSAAELPGVLRQIEERVAREASPAAVERLRMSTYLLLGLRYRQDVIENSLKGVGSMARALEASSTYQKILREGLAQGRAQGRVQGRAEEARRILLRLGSKRFGPPDAHIGAALERLTDPEQLEQLAEQVGEVTSWEALGILRRDAG